MLWGFPHQQIACGDPLHGGGVDAELDHQRGERDVHGRFHDHARKRHDAARNNGQDEPRINATLKRSAHRVVLLSGANCEHDERLGAGACARTTNAVRLASGARQRRWRRPRCEPAAIAGIQWPRANLPLCLSIYNRRPQKHVPAPSANER